jgi:hypothetical protein
MNTDEKRRKHAEYVRNWYRNHPGYQTMRSHALGKKRPMNIAKDCASYLGVYVAERALSRFFDHIERMPINHPGYDFICGKGFKIDVKSSCCLPGNVNSSYWFFTINRNTVADYFLCLAFDNRESLNPMHVWLIPGKAVNDRRGICISNSQKGIKKYAQYEQPLDKVNKCCTEMKHEKIMGR